MAGLRTDGARYFFTFFANSLLLHYINICFATLCASISRDFVTASLIGNLAYTLQSMACGFFVNASHMPVYVRWTRWVAYVYYAFGAMISNQFQGFFGDCPYTPSDPLCLPYTGKYIIEVLGFPYNWITLPFCVNLAWAVGFYVAAAMFLNFFRVDISLSKQHGGKASDQVDTSVDAQASNGGSATIEPIKIDLRNIQLSIKKRGLKLKQRNINILTGINANFVPGSINAIMGPSGSGKSSLLNLMAARFNSTLFQKYIFSGEIAFNNTLPSMNVMSSICSYVTQDDDGLLPSLTVRETLYYAAYLRLPRYLKRAQKRKIADETILKMGLKDCADNLIGGEFVKGISGGEKRRVSICIQLLNDPKVLLLDEPTSGLDAFTAGSILQVLKSLAEEGRTVICSIHQPRSNIFAQFGNILLLAKGGKVAYNGPAVDMLSYFADEGHPCPPLTNPADHVLDIVSVNLQADWKEELTRNQVNSILERWEERRLASANNLTITESRQVNLPAEFGAYVREPASFMLAYPTLLSRGALNFMRSPHIMIARIMQVFGISLVFALYFSPLRDSYVGITNRLGLVQEITALYFVGMLNNMAVYPNDRNVFYREHDDNVYGVLPFFMVYATLEVPFEIITSILFSIMFVFVPGLPRTPAMLFATAYSSWIVVNCGESIGIVFNSVFKHEGFAVNLISVVLSLGTMMAGLMSLNMPGFLKGLNWISPLKYAVSVTINMAFEGQTFSCEGQAVNSDGTCTFNTGEQILQSYGLTQAVPSYLGAMAVCMIVYRALAFAILKIIRLKLGIRGFANRYRKDL